MSDTAMVPRETGDRPAVPAPLIDEQLADQLLGTAQGMTPGAAERTDAALLRAVACGDEAALAALYDRHAG